MKIPAIIFSILLLTHFNSAFALTPYEVLEKKFKNSTEAASMADFPMLSEISNIKCAKAKKNESEMFEDYVLYKATYQNQTIIGPEYTLRTESDKKGLASEQKIITDNHLFKVINNFGKITGQYLVTETLFRKNNEELISQVLLNGEIYYYSYCWNISKKIL